jgi:hypothetical protein
MSARHETPDPSATRERALVDRVIRELAGDDSVLDLAALVGRPPRASTLLEALRDEEDVAIVACVGVLEHLVDFVEVVEALVALCAERDATVVLAVPNNTIGTGRPADRASVWSEGAVDELRGLLPGDHVVFHETALRGAALVPEGASAQLSIAIEVDASSSAPVGFVLAFGPRAARLSPAVDVGAADVSAERAYERAQRAELEVLRATMHGSDARSALDAPNGAHPAESAG